MVSPCFLSSVESKASFRGGNQSNHPPGGLICACNTTISPGYFKKSVQHYFISIEIVHLSTC